MVNHDRPPSPQTVYPRRHSAHRTPRPFLFPLVFFLGWLLTACGGGGSGSCIVATVTVSPSAPVVPINSTVQFSAVATDTANHTCGSVTFSWSSSDTILAPIDPVSGLASTPYDGIPGHYQPSPPIITITAKDPVTGLSGTAQLTVNYSLFGPPTEYGLGGGRNPQALVIGQFNTNTNSYLDVAVANRDTGDITFLPGDGTGLLGIPSLLTTSGNEPVALATGSFNPLSDAFSDVAAVNSSSDNVAILLGNGTGSFNVPLPATVATNQKPQSVATGDFDGINGDDLAVANFSSADITILTSNGDGTFTNGQTITPTGSSGPVSIATGYIDGDTNLDLVVADPAIDTIWVILGNGDGTFQTTGISPVAVSLSPGNGPAAVVIGDFDGDGFADLAVVNQGTSMESCSAPIGSQDSVTILFGLGDGTFYPIGSLIKPPLTYSVGSNPRAIALGDFNQDGVQDLVTANYCSDDISVLEGVGDGTFQPAISFSTGMPGQDRPTGVAVGDLDNTGFDDIVVTDSGTDSVSVLLNNN
jgi:hypothetical protein